MFLSYTKRAPFEEWEGGWYHCRAVKILVLIGAVIWYLWRVYTLSYSPHEFPDPAFANKVWDRRSHYTAFLGALIVAAAVYLSGISHHWWVVVLVFLVSIFLVHLLQVGLVALIIYGRAAKVILRVKMGRGLGAPWLAPFAWTYYLTPEEKQRARQRHSSEGRTRG
jgi:hypothetical protein